MKHEQRIQSMNNENGRSTKTCYNNHVSISVDDSDFTGTIQIIGHFGASISVDREINLPKGKKIRMTFKDNMQKDVKSAEVVWSDLSGFGAKFI
jgi:hypothetical protein